ncbi:MAG: hypothetical protein WKF61_06150 [Luteimonas sp.]
MREYGQVQSSFWQSPDAQAFSDTGKLLALYLLTGPHTNGIGCFRLPDGYVMADLSWSQERVSEGFAELFAKGFANRFDGVVFMPNFLRWNRIANGNVAKARFGDFEALPKGEAKVRTALALLEFCPFWEAPHRTVLQTLSQTLSAGYANQNPTQPNPNQTQEQDQKRQAPVAPADFKTELFARWKSMPDGGGGAFLNKLFREHKPEQRVMEAVERTLDDVRADPKAFVLGVLRQEAATESVLDEIMARAI